MDIEIIKDNNKYDDQIRSVIINAFKQEDEAILVEKIKQESDYYISYIAIDKNTDKVVGHVMISPMLLNGIKNVLALAPVSVLDEYSNNGIGSLLIKAAIKEAIENNEYKLITVLGSDHYYNRFGFEGYDCKKFQIPFEVEARFFQVLEIEPEYLNTIEGNFDYPRYFGV